MRAHLRGSGFRVIARAKALASVQPRFSSPSPIGHQSLPPLARGLSLASMFCCVSILSLANPARVKQSHYNQLATLYSRGLIFSFAIIFLWRGLKLGVAKAARSPPCLPFLGRRSCVLILSEICFLKIVFCEGFSCFVLSFEVLA